MLDRGEASDRITADDRVNKRTYLVEKRAPFITLVTALLRWGCCPRRTCEMFSMKRFVMRTFWFCLFTMLTGMAGRLLWLASHTDTGLELLHTQWKDATLGLLAGRRTPVPSRESSDQAVYWLGEVDRVLSSEPENAERVAGAAMALDSPTWGFTSKYFWNVHAFFGFYWFPSHYGEQLTCAEDHFESSCRARCLDLSARATRIEPSNVAWWRLRALLLWRCTVCTRDPAPRDSAWAAILDECARHDPHNALYDYLAAHFYWESSLAIESTGTPDRLIVSDTQRFAHGVHCFEEGLAKPFLAIADGSAETLCQFLRTTRLPETEYVQLFRNHGVSLRRRVLLRDLWTWQGLRADAEFAAGHFTSALDLHRQNLQLLDQLNATGARKAFANVAEDWRVTTTEHMNSLARKCVPPLSVAALQEISSLEHRARLDSAVIRAAEQRVRQEWGRSNPQPARAWMFRGDWAMAVSTVAIGMLPSCCVVLLALGFAFLLLSPCSLRQDLPQVGPFGQALALSTAWTITVVLCGFAPARIISEDIQAWALTFLLIFTPCALVSWVLTRRLRRRGFRFNLRTLLIGVSGLCLLLALVSATAPEVALSMTLPFDVSIPARGWEGMSAGMVYHLIGDRGGSFWAGFQWIAYEGPYCTIARMGRSHCADASIQGTQFAAPNWQRSASLR